MEEAREMKTEINSLPSPIANNRMDEDSVAIRVEPLWAKPFTLKGFKLSDTLSHVFDEIVKKAKEIGMLCRHPEGMKLALPWKPPFKRRDTTLESVVELANDDDIGPFNTITMELLPPVIDLNGDVVEFREGEDSDLSTESSVEEDDEEDLDVEKPDDWLAYYKGKRGKKPIFAVMANLGIDGDFQLLDENEQPLPVAKVWDFDSIVTSASAVILAPNDRILNHLYALNRKEKEYVVLRIGLDLLSYVFLRFIRQVFPEMPIVAVTDLDPAHLDILAFLDSDLATVRRLYDLDLFHDESTSASEVDHIECVNIKWLGLRLSHRGSLLPEADFDALARPPSSDSDFDMFMHRVLKNPNVRYRNKWFQEFRLLKKYHKCVDFPSFGYDFIASGLSNKEWV